MLKALQAVLDDAHGGHAYVTDKEKHGMPEDWRPELIGDCDSFALWCREQLEQLGIQPDLVFCRTETGGGHLVLHVDGWILDNRHKWVMRQEDLPYIWLKIGKPDGTWYAVAS